MKLRTIFCVFMLVLGVSSFSYAGGHYIPPELVKEQRLLEDVLRKNPKSADAHFELAMNYAYTGWIEVAWSILKTIPDYDDNYAPKVLSKYNQLIKKEPKEWRHHFKIAFGHYFNKDKESALVAFQKALALKPNHPWIMGFVALLLGEKDEVDKSIELSKKAIEIEPNGTALHFLLAQAYLKKGNYVSFMGESMTIIKLKSAEAKYRPHPPGET